MFRLLVKLFPYRLFLLLFKLVGTIASAMIVISSGLFFLNLHLKNKNSEMDEEEDDDEAEEEAID